MTFDFSPFQTRRSALLDQLDGGVAVFPAAPVFIRNNDVEHDYRQDSDLWYLTGLEEPESVLVLVGTPNAEEKSILFVRERDPERESWDGPRVGVEDACRVFGVDAAYSIDSFLERLSAVLVGAKTLHLRIGGNGVGAGGIGTNHPIEPSIFDALRNARRRSSRSGAGAPTAIVDISESLHEMRLRKSPLEIDAMRASAAVTAAAHTRVMEFARPGMFEYEVSAEISRVFTSNGAQRSAYGSIVGSGPNATILHYRDNRRRIETGDLLLIDAGCELDFYASDVTRTFPVGRRFSEAERALYDVVLEAQLAAIACVRPGATTLDVHKTAVATLAAGLVRLGLIEGPTESAIESGEYRRYYLHRTSHWLGMDVHDVGAYTEGGLSRPFEPGMVLTVEPGLYVSKDDERVETKWRGIGIRIEDDILVTETGSENLTEAVPKTPEAIEAITAR